MLISSTASDMVSLLCECHYCVVPVNVMWHVAVARLWGIPRRQNTLCALTLPVTTPLRQSGLKTPVYCCPWLSLLQGFVKDRPTLLDVSTAGPLWGTAASGTLMLAGLGLSAAGLGDVTIDSPALADSFITGLLGQFVLGEALVNPEVGRVGVWLGCWGLWCAFGLQGRVQQPVYGGSTSAPCHIHPMCVVGSMTAPCEV